MDESIRQEMVVLLPRLRRFAFALTGSMDEGDDLVQATYERALDRLGQWQNGGNVKRFVSGRRGLALPGLSFRG